MEFPLFQHKCLSLTGLGATGVDFSIVLVLCIYHPLAQVRIEDDVLVTATGMELLTNVPRTVEEIEAWMQRGEKTWKQPSQS